MDIKIKLTIVRLLHNIMTKKLLKKKKINIVIKINLNNKADLII